MWLKPIVQTLSSQGTAKLLFTPSMNEFPLYLNNTSNENIRKSCINLPSHYIIMKTFRNKKNLKLDTQTNSVVTQYQRKSTVVREQ